ncbi:hypothetical protein SAMN05216490_0009 [Mucilaginibacter mallensis]|uniref:Uncharacterized protein n=1 Tax=Mucilaginibacter mallensis TaxID=652787 RepID=A0A1H1M7L9_MUCMA|nr:hypothetical protein SAMN05216490_0009 [Mucilaginibacter mallensis]
MFPEIHAESIKEVTSPKVKSQKKQILKALYKNF